MTRKEEIAFWRKQIDNAKLSKELHSQGFQIATQLESEAKLRLDVLGNKSGRNPKGSALTPKIELELKARLTQ